LQGWSLACVDASTRAASLLATEPQAIGEPKVSPNPGAVAAALVESAVDPGVAAALVDEPATMSDDESAVVAADEPKPPQRFNLRAALARCKTHPTARLKIEYAPGRAVTVNGARPMGGVGRCVEDVLERHPPSRSITLTP